MARGSVSCRMPTRKRWTPRAKNSGRLSPRAIAAAAKRAEAARLRAGGATFQQIGETLGVTTGRAHQLVDEALQLTVAESVDELRALTMARLETLMTVYFERAC